MASNQSLFSPRTHNEKFPIICHPKNVKATQSKKNKSSTFRSNRRQLTIRSLSECHKNCQSHVKSFSDSVRIFLFNKWRK